MTKIIPILLFALGCGGGESASESNPDSGGPLPADASVADAPDPEPSCEDGIRNQGEMDIDCGGPCEPCSDCSLAVRSDEVSCQRQRFEESLAAPACTHGFYSGNDENGTKYSFFSSEYDSGRTVAVLERSGDCFTYELASREYLGRLTADPHFARVGPLGAGNYNTISGNQAFSHNTTFLPAPGAPISVAVHFDDQTEILEFSMPVSVASMEADLFAEGSEELRLHFTYPSSRPELPTTVLVTINSNIACVVDSSYDSLVIRSQFLRQQAAGDRFFVRAQGYEFAARDRDGCRFQATIGGRNPGADRETTLRVDVQPTQ